MDYKYFRLVGQMVSVATTLPRSQKQPQTRYNQRGVAVASGKLLTNTGSWPVGPRAKGCSADSWSRCHTCVSITHLRISKGMWIGQR